YQAGGRGVDPGFIAAMERWVHPDLQPDLTLLFDVPAEVAEERRRQVREADRFESEQADFFASVRSHYLLRAGHDPKRFFVVDGTRPVEAVRGQLTELMQRWDG
ncbi:MAG: dTMP kinase, partial [Burkholderiaceae bacterium]